MYWEMITVVAFGVIFIFPLLICIPKVAQKDLLMGLNYLRDFLGKDDTCMVRNQEQVGA